MARQIVTEEAVNAAAAALLSEGTDPTIITVQARIGGGSYSTVKRYLEAWKVRQHESLGVVAVPESVQQKAGELLRVVWQTAVSDAGLEVARIREEAAATVTAVQEELSGAQHEIARLERIEAEQHALTEQLRQELHESSQALTTARTQAERVNELETQLAAARADETRRAEEAGRLSGESAALREQVAELLATLRKK